jgi:hypothetical protein
MRSKVLLEHVLESAGCLRLVQLPEQGRRGLEQRLVAILDRAVGDRDREKRLAAPWSAEQDRTAALLDELRPEEATERLELHRILEAGIELLDRLEEREARLAHGPRDARLAAVRDLLGDELLEQLAVGPALLLGLGEHLARHAPDGREVQTLETRLEVGCGAAAHERTSNLP